MSGANRRVIHPFLFTWDKAYFTQLLYQESSLSRTVNITFASGMALKSVSHSRLPGLKREDKYDSYDMGHMGLLRTGMFYMHLQIVIHIDFMFFIFVYNVLYLG